MDAWARVRPRERDGDSGRMKEQEVAGGGLQQRGSERGTEGREVREGWTGWIRRLAAIDFSRQTRGLFVPLLVLVLLSSVLLLPSLSHSISLSRTLLPATRPPPARVSGPSPSPSLPFSLARSLFALLLVNALPPFDSRSAALLLSFSSLCSFFFPHAFASRDLSASFFLSLASYIASLLLFFARSLSFLPGVLKRFNSPRPPAPLSSSLSPFSFPSVSHILRRMFFLSLFLSCS